MTVFDRDKCEKTFHWSRIPGKFLNKETGEHFDIPELKFTGSVREWYETLVETVRDLGYSFVSEDVEPVWLLHVGTSEHTLLILQASVLYKPALDVEIPEELLGEDWVSPRSIKGPFGDSVGVISEFNIYTTDQCETNEILLICENTEDGTMHFGNVLIDDPTIEWSKQINENVRS